jgi:N-acetylglutamate synthase-like GNAT family acetyltransferase
VHELAQWHQQEWRASGRSVPVTRRVQRLRSHLHTDTLPNTWVALQEGALVGSVSLVDYVFQEERDTSAWVANLFVVPDCRHRGLGAQLLEFAETEASHCQLQRLFLFTPNRRDFYQQHDWQFLHQARVQGQWVDVMMKALNPEFEMLSARKIDNGMGRHQRGLPQALQSTPSRW